MKPVDFRNNTFSEIRSRISGDRAAVLSALRDFGPCTTRSLAQCMQWDILRVRPRVTELCQLGFVRCLERAGHEGQYRACTEAEAEAFFSGERLAATDPQLRFKI